MTLRRLYYLGPEGTFTHQAALKVLQDRHISSCVSDDADANVERDDPVFELVQCPRASDILGGVQRHEGWGVMAWENNVEGYVVPNLDGMIDARDAVGVARVSVNISFDAFVTRSVDGMAHDDPMPSVFDGWQVQAHPHGLAQCRRFIEDHRLRPRPAASNAAACRDLQQGQVALGPALCGDLYGLRTVADHIEDYPGARTDFLVLAPREQALPVLDRLKAEGLDEFETILALIPLDTGAGVLANLLDILRDAGLNMTSFISRPIKGHDGTYSFAATIDAAPWQPDFHTVIRTLIARGDWVKTLAVYPRRERPNPPVDAWMLPTGGVHMPAGTGRLVDGNEGETDMTRRELLW